MRGLIRRVGSGERGFTLIELLVVVAILGIIAAVVVLNIGSFLGTGAEQAANTEAHQVQTAVVAYMTANNITPTAADYTINSTSTTGPAEYLLNPGSLKAEYTITDGVIASATTSSAGWGSNCTFANGKWTCT